MRIRLSLSWRNSSHVHHLRNLKRQSPDNHLPLDFECFCVCLLRLRYVNITETKGGATFAHSNTDTDFATVSYPGSNTALISDVVTCISVWNAESLYTKILLDQGVLEEHMWNIFDFMLRSLCSHSHVTKCLVSLEWLIVEQTWSEIWD